MKRPILFAGTALTVFVGDQLTKAWVRAALAPGESALNDWPIQLTHVRNRGAAFGVLNSQTIFLVAAAAVGVVVILLYYRHRPLQNPLLAFGLGLQLGGAIGNLADRLIHGGYVTDFIDLRFWPVFNLADSSILVGVSILIYSVLRHELLPDDRKGLVGD